MARVKGSGEPSGDRSIKGPDRGKLRNSGGDHRVSRLPSSGPTAVPGTKLYGGSKKSFSAKLGSKDKAVDSATKLFFKGK